MLLIHSSFWIEQTHCLRREKPIAPHVEAHMANANGSHRLAPIPTPTLTPTPPPLHPNPHRRAPKSTPRPNAPLRHENLLEDVVGSGRGTGQGYGACSEGASDAMGRAELLFRRWRTMASCAAGRVERAVWRSVGWIGGSAGLRGSRRGWWWFWWCWGEGGGRGRRCVGVEVVVELLPRVRRGTKRG